MGKTLLSYFIDKKKEARAKGENYTQERLSAELGVSTAYIYTVLVGKRIVSFKMADMIEQATDGKLKAADLLEDSIASHRKWLERKKKIKDHSEITKNPV